MDRASGTLIQAPVLWMGTSESQGFAKATQPVKLQSQDPLPGSPFLWLFTSVGRQEGTEVKAQMTPLP